MPNFSYTAIAKTGERINGTEQAKDERQLARMLHEKGYIVTTVTTKQKERSIPSLDSLVSSLRGVSLVDKLLFTRNLQVMIAAGTPLPKTLEILVAQTTNKRFKATIQEIHDQVVGGKSLSEAMQQHEKTFSELYVNMIAVGENSGTLENVLSQLTLQLEREHELRSQVLGAMMYPAVIICAMIGIGILMLVLVVPQLASVFEDLGVELPLSTRIILGSGTFMANYWFLVVPGLLALAFGVWRLTKTNPGKRAIDKLTLHLPVISGIVRKTNAALMTRTLSSLISAGVPIVEAIQVTSRVLNNIYFQESLAVSAAKVGKGAKFSSVLQEYGHLYPIVVIQMIAVGEETGETSKILSKLAEFFEGEVETVTKNLTSVIEPVLMLVVGAMVGFFAISMIQPMYSVLSGLQ